MLINQIINVFKAINHYIDDTEKTCSNEETHQTSRCTDKVPNIKNYKLFTLGEN